MLKGVTYRLLKIALELPQRYICYPQFAFRNSFRSRGNLEPKSLTVKPGRRVQWSERSVYKIGAGLRGRSPKVSRNKRLRDRCTARFCNLKVNYIHVWRQHAKAQCKAGQATETLKSFQPL